MNAEEKAAHLISILISMCLIRAITECAVETITKGLDEQMNCEGDMK